MQKIVRVADKVGDWMGVLSGALLVGLMLLIVGNVIARQVASPFGGTAELVGYFTALITALGLSYSQKKKAHIAIDLLTSYLPARVQAAVVGVMLLIGVAVLAMASWQITVRARDMRRTGILSDTLQIEYYLLLWVVAGCVFVFALRVLVDAMVKLADAARRP